MRRREVDRQLPPCHLAPLMLATRLASRTCSPLLCPQYTGWMHVLLILTVLSYWYRPVLYFNILLWSTLLLPPKPVLWGAFCKSSVFRTWREYFSFSYLFEEVLDSKKKYIFAE